MAGDFIPFLPSARIKAGPGASPAAHFAPVHHPAAVRGSTSTAGTVAQSSSASPVPVSHQQVSIELKREGDRIAQIRIQCRCGELIELDCEY